MSKHVVKYDHEDGKKLERPIAWCGISISPSVWHFTDTHHVALSAGGSIQPCKNCIKAIIKELEKEL